MMDIIELIAVIASILYIVLAAKEKVSCFIFGLIGSALYIYLCIEARYYYDAFINGYYVVMSIYGIYRWKGVNDVFLKVNSVTPKKLFKILALGTLLTLLLGFVGLEIFKSDLPFVDAFTTVFAFIATWMVVQKNIENWAIWIVVDFVGMFMYWHKDMHLTSGLYLLYTIIAIFGYIAWKRKLAPIQ